MMFLLFTLDLPDDVMRSFFSSGYALLPSMCSADTIAAAVRFVNYWTGRRAMVAGASGAALTLFNGNTQLIGYTNRQNCNEL